MAPEKNTPVRRTKPDFISVILPTYNEADNIARMIPALSQVLQADGIRGEIIVVDDNSPDATAAMASQLSHQYPVRVHVRKSQRGLSRAVIEGFQLADGSICVVMDADLSHPVDKIPAMVKPILENRCDATVGSRYIRGGGSESWSVLRRMVSKGAGLLAKGVTRLSDPTSGFMAIRKSAMDGIELDPLGWKIVLETVVKTGARVVEIPIVFSDRQSGQSKFGLKVQVEYLRHLWRLYGHKYPSVRQFIKFCVVGLSGFFIDTVVLVALVDLFFLDPRAAAVFAFFTAVTWNYFFDRVWAFEYGRETKIPSSYVSFVAVYIIGLPVRIGVMHALIEYAGMGESPWYILASFIGIVAATVFNFLGSKYVAFSKFFQKA
jgi:dolichol-phosphate mannosyltransferase